MRIVTEFQPATRGKKRGGWGILTVVADVKSMHSKSSKRSERKELKGKKNKGQGRWCETGNNNRTMTKKLAAKKSTTRKITQETKCQKRGKRHAVFIAMAQAHEYGAWL